MMHGITDPPASKVEEPAHSPLPITRWTLFQVFWRSFFFLATANYQRMQNVGFAYCMLPALKRLHRGRALRLAMERHLEFFNSHPYMAGALLGAAVHIEEKVATGEADPARVQGFKRTMMGPLAAVGDSFFWTSLKPFAAAWALVGIFSGVLWAPVAFLLLYNFCHIGVRAFGIVRGYAMGEQVVLELNRLHLVRLSDTAQLLAGLCLGTVTALLARDAHRVIDLGDGLEPILFVTLILIALLSLKRQLPMLLVLYTFAGGCLLFVLGLQALFPIL